MGNDRTILNNGEPFSHIRRFIDRRFPHEIAQILPGEYFVSKEPKVIFTILGSCISACVIDPVLKLGGMNHFMLPEPKKDSGYDSWGESARYGSYAMELLINEIMKRGGVKSRLEVKLFGGARLYNAVNQVGQKNADWALNYMKYEALKVVATDTGDIYPRKLYYFSDTGRILMKKIKRIKNNTIFDREKDYQRRLDLEKAKHEKKEEDVTLF